MCLNILRESVIFLPSTALIVIILLVWAQLQAGTPRFSGNKLAEDKRYTFTLLLGSAFIYVAILSALVAFALHVFRREDCAIGFFGLAFLIAVSHIFIAIVRTFIMIKNPKYKGVEAEPGSCKRKKLWIATSIGVAGLGILSFSLAYGYLITFWWIWLLIGIIVAIFVFIPLGYIIRIMKTSDEIKNDSSNEDSCAKLAIYVLAICYIMKHITKNLKKK